MREWASIYSVFEGLDWDTGRTQNFYKKERAQREISQYGELRR